MNRQKNTLDEGRLEHSCGHGARDRVLHCGRVSGVERLEAAFGGTPFAPHRHDVYGICLTLSGVQQFRYRGARHTSLPGDLVILHPDELHDGQAGTQDGFCYRMIYLDPSQVAGASGGGLPHCRDPVVPARSVPASVRELFDDFTTGLDEPLADDIGLGLADYLCALDPAMRRPAAGTDREAMARLAGLLGRDFGRTVSMDALEAETGLGKWQMIRQFRAVYGTSPYRYRVLRRIDEARRLMDAGVQAADAAAAAGFSDQSHMSRQFKKTYGMTPGTWMALRRSDGEIRPARQSG